MTPAIAQFNDVYDIIRAKSDLLEGTFLSPMHLLCLAVSWISNTWLLHDESTWNGSDEEAKLSLIRELDNFIPRSHPEEVADDLAEFISFDLKHHIEPILQSLIDMQENMPCKLYAYPVLEGMVVITDEEQHETCFEKLYGRIK